MKHIQQLAQTLNNQQSPSKQPISGYECLQQNTEVVEVLIKTKKTLQLILTNIIYEHHIANEKYQKQLKKLHKTIEEKDLEIEKLTEENTKYKMTKKRNTMTPYRFLGVVQCDSFDETSQQTVNKIKEFSMDQSISGVDCCDPNLYKDQQQIDQDRGKICKTENDQQQDLLRTSLQLEDILRPRSFYKKLQNMDVEKFVPQTKLADLTASLSNKNLLNHHKNKNSLKYGKNRMKSQTLYATGNQQNHLKASKQKSLKRLHRKPQVQRRNLFSKKLISYGKQQYQSCQHPSEASSRMRTTIR